MAMRFGMKKDSLWRRVVIARFCLSSSEETRRIRCKHGCGLWKSIMKLKSCFWNLVSFKAGSDSDISFWADRWVGEFPLNMVFRSLSLVVVNSRVSVADFLTLRGMFGCLGFVGI